MRLTLLVLVGATLFIGGCTGLIGGTDREVEKASQTVNTKAADIGLTQTLPKLSPVTIVNDAWLVGKKTVPIQKTAELPPIFSQPATFERTVSGLQEFAERVTLRTGLPVRIMPDAQEQVSGVGSFLSALPAGGSATGPSAAPSGPSAGGGGSGGPLPPSYLGAVNSASSTARANSNVHISYQSGTLKGLLDTVAFRFGISWRYEHDSIVFYYMESRTFAVKALAGSASLDASIAPKILNSGQGQGSSADGSTKFSSSLALWSDLEGGIKARLSTGGKVALAPAAGVVTVTDTPVVLDEVQAFIDKQNAIYSRQVVLNIMVMTVTLNDEDNYGIDWSAVFSGIGHKYPLGITTNSGITTTSANVFSLQNPSKANTILAQALSTQGKVKKQTAAAVTALNYQPVPIQVATSQAYLASSSTSISNGTVTTTLTPGNISTGFTMQLFPAIQEDNSLLLQFATSISVLKNIAVFASGGSQVQLPDVDSRDFLQRVALNSGETLVVSGFEQADGSINWSGVGAPQNIALGGSVDANKTKEIIVIAITPVIASKF